jgi:hypothetical protein
MRRKKGVPAMSRSDNPTSKSLFLSFLYGLSFVGVTTAFM